MKNENVKKGQGKNGSSLKYTDCKKIRKSWLFGDVDSKYFIIFGYVEKTYSYQTLSIFQIEFDTFFDRKTVIKSQVFKLRDLILNS